MSTMVAAPAEKHSNGSSKKENWEVKTKFPDWATTEKLQKKYLNWNKNLLTIIEIDYH